MCMHRMLECHVHLFIRMFPTGPAVMRPVPPRCDRAELIRREERSGMAGSVPTAHRRLSAIRVFSVFIKSINKASHIFKVNIIPFFSHFPRLKKVFLCSNWLEVHLDLLA